MINKVTLNNVSAVYDKKMDKMVLIAKDEMFDKGFRVVLKDNTPESDALKKELVKMNELHDLSKLLMPESEFEEHIIPLGTSGNNGETMVYWDLRRSNVLLITGKVGGGKDNLLQAVKEYLLDCYDTYSVYGRDFFHGLDEESDWKLLSEASKSLHERIQLQGTHPDTEFDKIFYVINYVDRLVSKYGENALFLLESIAKYGNKLGVNLILGAYTPDFSIMDNQEKVEIGTDGINIGKIILSDRENIDFNGYMSKYSYEDSLKNTLNKISDKQK